MNAGKPLAMCLLVAAKQYFWAADGIGTKSRNGPCGDDNISVEECGFRLPA